MLRSVLLHLWVRSVHAYAYAYACATHYDHRHFNQQHTHTHTRDTHTHTHYKPLESMKCNFARFALTSKTIMTNHDFTFRSTSMARTLHIVAASCNKHGSSTTTTNNNTNTNNTDNDNNSNTNNHNNDDNTKQ